MLIGAVVQAEEAKPADDPAKGPKVQITLDTSAAPEMAAWGAKAKEVCEQQYKMICGELAEEKFEPPTRVQLVFDHAPGIADTTGRRVRCSAKWFIDHPDDYGAVVHEMAHVVQAYHGGNTPGWLVEGIADYVRWFRYEPVEKRPKFDAQRQSYTAGYQVAGAFLDWIVANKKPQFVRKMNIECRHGKYRPELWSELAGGTVDELWTEFAGRKRLAP
jgi:hypothetical protein